MPLSLESSYREWTLSGELSRRYASKILMRYLETSGLIWANLNSKSRHSPTTQLMASGIATKISTSSRSRSQKITPFGHPLSSTVKLTLILRTKRWRVLSKELKPSCQTIAKSASTTAISGVRLAISQVDTAVMVKISSPARDKESAQMTLLSKSFSTWPVQMSLVAPSLAFWCQRLTASRSCTKCSKVLSWRVTSAISKLLIHQSQIWTMLCISDWSTLLGAVPFWSKARVYKILLPCILWARAKTTQL